MKKNTSLWIIAKFSLLIVAFYTLMDLISGKIKWSEIPSHALDLIIRLFVSFFIMSIIYFIIVKVFRIKL
jgi:hypothetical protein